MVILQIAALFTPHFTDIYADIFFAINVKSFLNLTFSNYFYHYSIKGEHKTLTFELNNNKGKTIGRTVNLKTYRINYQFSFFSKGQTRKKFKEEIVKF